MNIDRVLQHFHLVMKLILFKLHIIIRHREKCMLLIIMYERIFAESYDT